MMVSHRLILAAFGSMLVCAANATEIVASCGPSEGYGYFIAGGAIPFEKAAWIQDGLSDRTVLTKNGSDYDILIVRDDGTTTTATSSGAKVFVLAQTSDAIIVLAIYPGLYERYMFRFSPQREVIWGSTRWDSPVNKDSLYRAECSQK
jgi:hypothetical protein